MTRGNGPIFFRILTLDSRSTPELFLPYPSATILVTLSSNLHRPTASNIIM